MAASNSSSVPEDTIFETRGGKHFMLIRVGHVDCVDTPANGVVRGDQVYEEIEMVDVPTVASSSSTIFDRQRVTPLNEVPLVPYYPSIVPFDRQQATLSVLAVHLVSLYPTMPTPFDMQQIASSVLSTPLAPPEPEEHDTDVKLDDNWYAMEYICPEAIFKPADLEIIRNQIKEEKGKQRTIYLSNGSFYSLTINNPIPLTQPERYNRFVSAETDLSCWIGSCTDDQLQTTLILIRDLLHRAYSPQFETIESIQDDHFKHRDQFIALLATLSKAEWHILNNALLTLQSLINNH
jgi:hypothetical protein